MIRKILAAAVIGTAVTITATGIAQAAPLLSARGFAQRLARILVSGGASASQ